MPDATDGMEKRNIVEKDRTPTLEKQAVDEGKDWTEIASEFEEPDKDPA